MQSARWFVAAVTALGTAGTAWAVEGNGLLTNDSAWPRWQARLSILTTPPLLRHDSWRADYGVNGAAFLGDYYFTRSMPRLGNTGGFRATSGVLLGARSAHLLSAGQGGRTLNVQRRNDDLRTALLDDSQETVVAPYVGVGFTALYGKSRWGFSADFGLVGRQSGSAVKLGVSVSGQQNLDDAVRELRLSPLMQLGVSYSF